MKSVSADTEYAGDPALPRARTEMAKLISRARDRFQEDPKVIEFLERIDRGDLHKPIWDAIANKVADSDRSSVIAGKCLAAVDQLWRKNPPAPVDFLVKLFSQPQAKTKVLSADNASVGRLTAERLKELLNMTPMGRAIVADESSHN